MNTLRIATRKSALALAQTNKVAESIKKKFPSLQIEVLPMVTSGDKLQKLPSTPMNKGLFVKELEDALLQNRADIAVHSMKDMPSILPEGLALKTICSRENPLDALITRDNLDFASLPKHSIIGTSSLRRQSQLLLQRPDLKVSLLRGNVNTRLNKLHGKEFDAIVLAVAGLKRLGLQQHIHEVFDESFMVPACGQGALGIECRESDNAVHAFIDSLNDSTTAICVQTERKVNQLLGGSCNLPLGVYCKLDINEQLILHARILTPCGQTMIEDRQTAHQRSATSLAEKCVSNLLDQGAHRILQECN